MIGAAGTWRRKLVALPEELLMWLQGVADEEYPNAIPGKPGNASAVVRDACEHYRKHKKKREA